MSKTIELLKAFPIMYILLKVQKFPELVRVTMQYFSGHVLSKHTSKEELEV